MATDTQIQNDPYLSQLNQFLYGGGASGLTAQNRSDWADQMTTLTGNFKSRFQDMVGRAPTADEVQQFATQYIQPHVAELTNPASARSQDPYTYLNQFVANTYGPAAKDYATQQLQSQQGQANDLANLFRTQGNEAINQTESSLLDYQSRLFEKLRPNLITSLQAQGLLDTGGLDKAIAGAQGDLANSVAPWLAQQRLANEQGANQIAFSGASAPYQYKQNLALNQVPYMQTQGQAAMNQGYNTFLTNLNFQNQLALMNRQGQIQSDMQPSMLSNLGHSFVSNFGGSTGTGMGAWTNPAAFSSGNGGMSGAAGAKALFA